MSALRAQIPQVHGLTDELVSRSITHMFEVKTGQRPEAIFGHRQSYGVEKVAKTAQEASFVHLFGVVLETV